MLISYNWLKSYIKELPKPEVLTDLITFHICEIESIEKKENGDTIFDLKILPDRAHDLLSHRGIAKEISGLLGEKIMLPEFLIPDSSDTKLSIEINTPNCRRYMGRIIRNVKIGPSPKWIVDYLESLGQRSINNIVDVTNIIMFDLGQPTHAFDLGKLAEEKIIIKNAKNNDKIFLVGSEKISVKLKESDMMITDGKENLAIAGVKGGLISGIGDDTKNILVEVANFDPVSVRKTARRLGLQTDASKRFENNLSPELCKTAMEEISALIREICPDASFEKIIDVYPYKQETRKVSFTSKYISDKLGVYIDNDKIEEILESYNYIFSKETESFEVTIPFLRFDLEGPQDFIEEIGRVYGYDKIKAEIPKIKVINQKDQVWTNICLAKVKLINDGYHEIMTRIFSDKGEIEIHESASDKNFLRTNLSEGIKESLKLNKVNLPLLDIIDLKIFEVGTVFLRGKLLLGEKQEIKEEIHVCYADEKNINEMTLDDFIREKIPIEERGDNVIEEKLMLTPKETSESLEKVLKRRNFKAWSAYPFIVRDIAVWLPVGIEPEKLIEIYKQFGTELLIKEPKLFDSFTKNDRTSFAYRLVFQAVDRTLTDEEVNMIMQKIYEKINSFGWQVR